MHKGKKYVDSAKTIDRTKQYDPAEALSTVVSTAKAKFDETIELHVKLGVDSRHADQQVRGAIVLPHGTGKQVRVAVFAKGAKADEALAAGADIVGAEDLMERIQKENFFEFDVVIATPDMMGVVGRLGRVLGPKGLMPNPRLVPYLWTLPRLFRSPRLVRSSTVSTRPTSSTARSARLPSALRSCRTTSTL